MKVDKLTQLLESSTTGIIKKHYKDKKLIVIEVAGGETYLFDYNKEPDYGVIYYQAAEIGDQVDFVARPSTATHGNIALYPVFTKSTKSLPKDFKPLNKKIDLE